AGVGPGAGHLRQPGQEKRRSRRVARPLDGRASTQSRLHDTIRVADDYALLSSGAGRISSSPGSAWTQGSRWDPDQLAQILPRFNCTIRLREIPGTAAEGRSRAV